MKKVKSIKPADEDISALTDGEIKLPKQAMVIEQMVGDEGLGTWERYHLIREIIRQRSGRPKIIYDDQIANKVQQALANELVGDVSYWHRCVHYLKSLWVKDA